MSSPAPSPHAKNAQKHKIVISSAFFKLSLSTSLLLLLLHTTCLLLWACGSGFRVQSFTPNYLLVSTWPFHKTDFPCWQLANKMLRLTHSYWFFLGLCSHKHIYLANMLLLRVFHSGNKMLPMENSSFYCFPIKKNLEGGQKWNSYEMKQAAVTYKGSLLCIPKLLESITKTWYTKSATYTKKYF